MLFRFVLLILSLLLPVCAQTWQEQVEAGKKALQARNFEKAREVLEAVRDESLKTGNSEAGLASAKALIHLYRVQGDWPKTEELLNQAVAFAAPSVPEMAALYGELAMALRALSKGPEALAALDRAIVMRSRPNSDLALLARDLTMSGLLYLENKNEDAAMGRFHSALLTWEQILREDPEVLPALEGLAGVYRDKSEYVLAEPLYARALRIREIAFGPASAEVIGAVDSLAYVYFGLRDYEKAEPYYKRLYDLWATSAGPDHPMVALTLDKMVVFYTEQKRFGEAIPLAEKAQEIRAKAYLAGLRTRARIGAAQGDEEAAFEFGEKAALFIDFAGLPKPEQQVRPLPPGAKPVKPAKKK